MVFRFSLLIFFALLACHKNEESGSEFHGTTISVREQGTEFQIPAQIWDLLLRVDEGDKIVLEPKEGQKKEEVEPELATASFLYAPVAIVLREKNLGVLKEPAIKIEFSEGGGEVDLARWTTGKNGTFYVQFVWEGADPEATEKHVFFYSRSRKRKVGDQTIGTGCHQFMDLTNYIVGLGDKGLTVNTTRNFHSSVLGGHFIFSWVKDTVKKVTRITFKDSQNPSYSCENEK